MHVDLAHITLSQLEIVPLSIHCYDDDYDDNDNDGDDDDDDD